MLHLTNSQEVQIVEECLKGAQSAFKALYDLYKGYVYTICVRYGVSAIEIKDTMQIIFMEVFKSLNKYDFTRAKFKTWLSRIAINQILIQKRKYKIDYTTLETEEISVIESDFSIPIESNMDEKMMHEILSKMPPKYITVFNLFIIDEYSHSEISAMLGISLSASKTNLHRGRAWAMKEIKSTFKDSVNAMIKAKHK